MTYEFANQHTDNGRRNFIRTLNALITEQSPELGKFPFLVWDADKTIKKLLDSDIVSRWTYDSSRRNEYIDDYMAGCPTDNPFDMPCLVIDENATIAHINQHYYRVSVTVPIGHTPDPQTDLYTVDLADRLY